MPHDPGKDIVENRLRDYELAVTELILEFDALTPRARKKLAPELHRAIADMAEARKLYQDAVYTETQLRIKRDEEHDDSMVPVVYTEGVDGEAIATVYPESRSYGLSDGFLHLLGGRIGDGHTLLRMVPLHTVIDMRNVPREHPVALAAVEWTLESQGAPSWEDELNSPEVAAQIAELAGENAHPKLPGLIKQYLSIEGEMPAETWIQDAREQLAKIDEANAAIDATTKEERFQAVADAINEYEIPDDVDDETVQRDEEPAEAGEHTPGGR